MDALEAYEMLIGSRVTDSELVIPGFRSGDYEELLDLFLEELVIPELGHRDYFTWLHNQARTYHNFTRSNRVYPDDFYNPLLERPDSLTTRQQLSIIKHWIYKQKYKRPYYERMR